MKYSNEDLLRAITEFYHTTGRVPTKREFSLADTIKARFGSWNNGIALAQLPINRKGNTPLVTKLCPGCDTPTTNPMFCSRGCAATYNNTKRTKPIRLCELCQTAPASSRRSPTCRSCRSAKADKVTVAEACYEHLPRSARLARIRSHASSRYKNEVTKGCQRCHYSNHAEVAHIQAISSFPDTATMGEVNHPSNILILCPNCHWEFDHKMLNLDQIPPRN